MSHEKWLLAILSSTVAIILSLVAALTFSLNWSLLSISTLLFVMLYPLIWLAWRCYQFWQQAIMQLTTYTQILKEGEFNLHFKKQHPDNLLFELQKEIRTLGESQVKSDDENQTVENLLSKILDTWPVPVCLFDHQLNLTYRNLAMNENIQQPMLIGTPSTNLGFTLSENVFSHPLFDEKWHCQSINYLHQGKKNWLFSALDISKLLNKNQSITQENLIRVLGHELRNSLTPMTSMADTLLCQDELEEEQTRKVLSRIQQRSNRLLDFIDQYSQLSQLPPPNMSWFDFTEIYTEAKSMINGQCQFNFQGNTQCYGDANQIAQVLINVFKNAKEACLIDNCEITVKVFYLKKEQIIEITDNGPGFANLNNVLTPFYTTKPHGSGIGLSLCAGITRNHHGRFNVVNVSDGGARITLAWPITELP